MFGPKILARSLSRASVRADKFGNHWQYHSRSDRHSKIACWCILFDLVQESALLRRHFEQGSVRFGVNHELRDFRVNRKKNLDLVVATERAEPAKPGKRRRFHKLAAHYGIVLEPQEEDILQSLPEIREAPVGSVRLALEAKACMTAHSKAVPRLHDELSSSHQTIHGAAEEAVAVGFVMVNAAESFISPDMNKFPAGALPRFTSSHKQPQDAAKVLQALEKIPRRARRGETGYDAFGTLVVDLKNDGSKVKVVEGDPAPGPGDIFHYEQMIRKAAARYNSQFPND